MTLLHRRMNLPMNLPDERRRPNDSLVPIVIRGFFDPRLFVMFTQAIVGALHAQHVRADGHGQQSWFWQSSSSSWPDWESAPHRSSK